MLSGPDYLAADLGVLRDGSDKAASRRGPPKSLFDRRLHQRAVRRERRELVRIGRQPECEAGQQRAGGVRTAHEDQAVVKHPGFRERLAVKVGAQEGRDQVIAGLAALDLELLPEE